MFDTAENAVNDFAHVAASTLSESALMGPRDDDGTPATVVAKSVLIVTSSALLDPHAATKRKPAKNTEVDAMRLTVTLTD